jgi:hypothetical protein
VHLGPAATAFERRSGKLSYRRLELQQEAAERLLRAHVLGESERQIAVPERGLIDTSTDVATAQRATLARAAFRAQFEREQQAKPTPAAAEKTPPLEKQPPGLGRTAPERKLDMPEHDGPARGRGRDRDKGLSR